MSQILEALAELVEALYVEKGNQGDSLKTDVSTNVMETFLGVGHVPPKKVEHVDHVLEKTGVEDLAGKLILLF